jgi:phage tail protein X
MTMGVMTAAEFAAAYGMVPAGTQAGPALAQYLAYTTGPADRWDTIAWRAYGDPTLVGGLILANATIAISPVLPQGVTVYCPLIAPPPPPAGTTPWNP